MNALTPFQVGFTVVVGGALVWLFWPQKTDAGKPLRSVALVGDSLGVGLGPPLAEELRPASLVTRAHVSATARDWATGKYASELKTLLAGKPELVLFSLGTNDTVPPGKELSLELPQNFKTLADLVREGGGVPVFLSLSLPWSTQRIEEAAKLAGARLLESAGVSRQTDGIHPTGTGYATWAKLVAANLRSSTVGHPIDLFTLS